MSDTDKLIDIFKVSYDPKSKKHVLTGLLPGLVTENLSEILGEYATLEEATAAAVKAHEEWLDSCLI